MGGELWALVRGGGGKEKPGWLEAEDPAEDSELWAWGIGAGAP